MPGSNFTSDCSPTTSAAFVTGRTTRHLGFDRAFHFRHSPLTCEAAERPMPIGSTRGVTSVPREAARWNSARLKFHRPNRQTSQRKHFMPISEKIKALIRIRLDNGAPCLVATQGPNGPNISPKGSMVVFDDDHLAYWERSKKQAFRRFDERRHLRRRQPRHLVGRDRGARLRGGHGVPAPEPRAGAHRHRVRRPVGLLVADRPGRIPVPLLHRAAVRDPRARLPRRRALARAVTADVAGRPPGRGRPPDRGAGRPVAPVAAAVRVRRCRTGEPRVGKPARRSSPTSS